MSYLADLTLKLSAGTRRLPEGTRRCHGAYLAAAQNSDGGFSGRQGPSDLYYTSFALRGLALLGCLDERSSNLAADFLQERLAKPAGLMDFLSLVQGALVLELATGIDVFNAGGRDRKEAVATYLQSLRRDDGGYAKSTEVGGSSTYATFLAVSYLQLLGLPIEGTPKIVALVQSRQRPDGGYVETPPLQQSGTNPTAAAVGLLRVLDALDKPTAKRAAAFLAGVQNAEGGLRANIRTPFADLLSTFTGLVTLDDLEAMSSIDAAAARRYVQTLERHGGGFRGGVWDNATDCEYTFYGIGSLALLSRGNV